MNAPEAAGTISGLVVGIATLAAFFLLVGLVVLLRTRSDGKVEVKLADVAVAVVPVLLGLLAFGVITKFEVGPEKLTVERAATAIRQASAATIDRQVSRLPVEPIETSPKGPVVDIPTLINKRTEGLSFTLGAGGYVGGAIQQYLSALTKFPFFRYVVFNNPDGSLFGVIDARKLAALVEQGAEIESWDRLADLINRGDSEAIARLPGFVPREMAVSESTDKQEALQKLENADVDWLPVVDGNGRFVGGVERSRLTASLILDVANRLKQQ
jgi:hypothetical protein